MRILFCTNSLGARGGIERVTIVKANALAEIPGNEVCVCYTDRGTYPESTIHPVSEKVQVIDLGVSFWDLYPLGIKALLVTAPRKFVNLRKALKRTIRQFRPDVVITTGSYEKYALATLHLPDIVKIREFHFNSQYRCYNGSSRGFHLVQWFEYTVLGKCFDMNLLLTREDMDTNFAGCRNYGYQHNPTSFTDTDIIPMPQRDKVVLALGRLAHQKNFASLLRAWSKTIKPAGWKLFIAGDGDLRAELEKLAADLDIKDSVRFLGFRSDVPQLMAHSGILAMTSLYEGLPLNLLEAMTFGTVPVTYTTPCGPRDVITDNVDGILVDYLDEDAFASKLSTLMSSPTELERLSAGAVRRSHDFSVENIISQLMVKYVDLINKKRKAK